MLPDEETKEETVNRTDAGRAWRRGQVLGMKKVIRKLQKGYSAEKVAKQMGIALEAVQHVEAIIKVQQSVQEVGPAESQVFIDGEEV